MRSFISHDNKYRMHLFVHFLFNSCCTSNFIPNLVIARQMKKEQLLIIMILLKLLDLIMGF